MVISSCFSRGPEEDLFSHLSQKPDCTTPSPVRLCRGRWCCLAFCSCFHFHKRFRNIFGRKDRILVHFMTSARKSLLETVLHCVMALLSMLGSATGRGHICQAVYSAPSADPEGLWERSASPATDPTSQSQSKRGAFPPDLSSLFPNLRAYAVPTQSLTTPT